MQAVRKMLAEHSLRPESEQVRLEAERYRFLKRRWQGLAEDGTEFAFDLESRLKSGCVIHQTDAADYVIVQKTEPVYQIATPSLEFAALVGWKIGNLHFPVQIVDGFLRVTVHPIVKGMIDREEWPHEEVNVVFQPLRLPPEVAAAAASATPGTKP
jgi:urease accessory protein